MTSGSRSPRGTKRAKRPKRGARAKPPAASRPRERALRKADALRLARWLQQENERAMAGIRLPGLPRPYFLSYLVRDEHVVRVRAKFGTIHSESNYVRRSCLADLRVGSHRYDQVQSGGLQDNDKEAESYEYVELPIGDQEDGVRHALWRLTEARFREAVDAYLQRKSHEVTYQNTHRSLGAFVKGEPVVDTRWRKLPEIDPDHWREYVRRASLAYRKCPLIKNGHVEFHAISSVKTFVDSEGSLQLQCTPYWTLELYFWYLGPNGDANPYTEAFFVTNPEELPTLDQVRKRIREIYEGLQQLATAPRVRSFSGPVLLDPRPAGLLMHEAIGHRLEGNRLLSTGEGHTFRDSIGKSVLPDFLSLRDDPRLATFEGKSLVGHYRYDDEGVPAQDVKMIERGVMRRFLSSRTPTQPGHKSNGHGRSRYHERPISRMGVTLVDVHDGLDDKALRARFIEEIRRQKVPYGIRVLRASGGETSTEAYNFQAFLGEIELAARVFPDGREELIRGVNFVGTPLNAIRNIVAAGTRREVDNSYCGAESGFVPVSTISPALLLSELELQSKSDTPFTQYVYPLPWESK